MFEKSFSNFIRKLIQILLINLKVRQKKKTSQKLSKKVIIFTNNQMVFWKIGINKSYKVYYLFRSSGKLFNDFCIDF